MILWCLLSAAVAGLAACFISSRRGRVRENKMRAHIKRLEEAQSYIQQHMATQDTLVAMLADIYRSGLSGTGPLTREELCRLIVEDACRLVRFPRGSLLIDNNGLMRVAASRGMEVQTAEQRVRVGDGPLGRVAETGEPLCVQDMRADKRFLREALPPLESSVMASVALRVKSRVLGVLTVNGAEGAHVLEDRDMRLLQILADHAAATLENFELYDNLQNFYLEMVQSLAHALDAKSVLTKQHIEKIRQTTRALARELGLPAALAQHVEYAALMHDIGKIGVDDAILRKPGKLTDEEYAKVKQHPAIGSRILAPVGFLAPVAPMILYHKEWFNGQGYPEGLAGEEIPLGARIVGLIDAWNAMTSDRPYRKAMSEEAALAEIRRSSGTQFDPRVVEAFVRVREKSRAAAAL